MAYHRLEEAGLSGLGPSSHSLAYGVHGVPAAAMNFGPDASAYIGELEEALMQGVVGIRASGDAKAFLAARQAPHTLEIFPSWPVSIQQASKSADSTVSGTAQNTPSARGNSPDSWKASVGRPFEQINKQEMGNSGSPGAGMASPNCHQSLDKRKLTEKNGKPLDAKTLRRLAQNREAARKSRMRKKAYVQQLETSRTKLTQLEQDLQRARSQGLLLGGGGTAAGGNVSSGAAMFDMEYNRWLEEDSRHMSELRAGLEARLLDGDLRVLVDECLTHYDEMFRFKGMAAASDAFHLIAGTWTTPAERCFLWIGGFRPSEMLKILTPQLDPLTEQQLVGICSLQQSAQQAEEALSQGLEQLQQSLTDIVAGGSPMCEDTNPNSYMSQMAVALEKLSSLEGFICQADNLRQQTLHQMRRILTVRQAARCFLAMGEYYSRLRALSSLWASRPRD